MKILLVEPEKIPCALEIDGSLHSMQAVVGGTIQAIYPFAEEIALVCNDEGKLLGLPLNRAMRDGQTGGIYEIIAGTFFLCGAPADADDFTSLTEEQVTQYTQRFYHPELFLKLNGAIIAAPIKKV